MGPVLPKVATINFQGANTLVTGSLRLVQQTVYSNIAISGRIFNLPPGNTININVRSKSDISDSCLNPGNVFFNPNRV
jgi:hypothetical protein